MFFQRQALRLSLGEDADRFGPMPRTLPGEHDRSLVLRHEALGDLSRRRAGVLPAHGIRMPRVRILGFEEGWIPDFI